MIFRKKNFIICLIFILSWHYSCVVYKSSIGIYKSKESGYDKNLFKYETTKAKFIFSKKDWLELLKKHKNTEFKELDIDDFKSHKEINYKNSIDYLHSIKIVEKYSKKKKSKLIFLSESSETSEEITVLFIHGLAGKEGDFFSIIKHLLESKFNYRLNLISGKRFDSCFKSIEAQAEEVKKKLLEYYSMYSKKKKHKLIIIGHSQGGIITLSLLKKLINLNYIDIKGLIFIGSPISGIDSAKNYMDSKRKKYPNVINIIEKSIFGCTFNLNPLGVIQTMKKNSKNLVNEGNNIIEKYKIPTKVLIGIKPQKVEYPQLWFDFLKKSFRLFDRNILNTSTIKKDVNSPIKIFKIIKELLIGLPNLSKLFNSELLAGQKTNDFLLSQNTQRWYLKNKYIENIELHGVAHNWKISLLISPSLKKRIVSELESSKTKFIVENLIKKVMSNNIKESL